MRRLLPALMVMLAIDYSRPFPWDRPAPAHGPSAARPLAEPAAPVPEWPEGLSEEMRKAMDDLQGSWMVTRARRNLQVDSSLTGATITVTGHRFTARAGDATTAGTWTVDPSRTPPALELVYTDGAEKGQKVQGISSRAGNAWIVIYASPGQPPPASFKEESQPGWTFLTLTRAE